MEQLFDLLPKPLLDDILRQTEKIRQTVLIEASQALGEILEKYKELNIYNIGLYYSAGSWSYLIPTFSSEEGLTLVAQGYAKHSVSGVEEQKTSLRWSPCDSPHHGQEEFDTMMPETQDALDCLDNILEQCDPGYDEQLMELYCEDDYYEIIGAVHERLRILVADALKEIRSSLAALNNLDLSKCVVSLSAGDLSEDVFLDSLRLINGEQACEKVRQDLIAAGIEHDLEFDRMQKRLEDERINPPTTQLTLNDFQPDIERFNPTFITINGGIYLDIPCDYPRDETSSCEYSFNRIEFMKQLEGSSHYDELDKLYGHFLGNNFKPDDLFPSICRAFAMKLSLALSESFPTDAFKLYMIVDRNTLYHMTFCKNRDDGFQFFTYLSGDQLGVEEIYLIEKNKVSILDKDEIKGV